MDAGDECTWNTTIGGSSDNPVPEHVRPGDNESRNRPLNQPRGGRRASGIMISRRPKSRASTENAPGPSKISAKDAAAKSIAVEVLM